MTTKSSTSLRVFRAHMKMRTNGEWDVDGVISRECYLEWLEAKGVEECDEEARKFHRVLTNHVSGVDGRRPFSQEEEAALLVLLRQRRSWPCFPEHLARIGMRYRSLGFHERQLQESSSSSSSAEALSYFFLASPQADRLAVLGNDIVRNFALPQYGDEESARVVDIMRYWVLASHTPRSNPTHDIAGELCNQYSLDECTLVTVYNLLAPDGPKLVAQNSYSVQILGALNNRLPMIHVQELFSTVTAVGAAFHEPGKCFAVPKQLHWCMDCTQVRAMDSNYYVHAPTLLLVVFGKLCGTN